MSVENILENVTLMPALRDADIDAWRLQRKNLIGSSDVVTIMELSKWQTPLELWAERTGKVAPKPDSRAARYGRKVESKILELFTEEHPMLEVIPNAGTYISKAHPFAAATPDAFVLRPVRDDDSELGLAEVKHTAYGLDEWQDGGAPTAAHIQVVWQMGVLVLPFAYITAVVAGRANEVNDPCFDFDDVAQQLYGQCLEKSAAFLECVKSDTPPGAGPGDLKLVQQLIQKRDETVQLPVELLPLVDELQAAEAAKTALNSKLKEHDAVCERVRAVLLQAAGGATHGLLPDGREVKFSQVNRKGYEVKPASYWTMKVQEGV